MTTKIVNAGSIKEGSYIIIDGAACKVTNVDIGKSGKHGHAKARVVAVGLIDEKKREIVLPAHDNVEVPIIEKKGAQVLSITGDKANVMDLETYETFDLDIPEELKATVTEGSQVLYWIILDKKVMKQLKSKE
ncbi:translation initiation factor IF-5A [Candidatus Woesearchaeota archaeon]|nr:translation initiation factor IF-5A [Candidatus Woesearchaeota archaeon]